MYRNTYTSTNTINIFIGVWGGGDSRPPKLRSGRNPCVIQGKHKNFGKMMLCPEKFWYVCENYGIFRKIFYVFGDLPPSPRILGRNIN
jgi:hypothetical protein